ncbi:Nucleoside-diphosphate-sugar pyrophosphorylase family protein [Halogeometricum borinquense DSM 11551]|uniref:Bifunctional protein GlmU n=2 Tax=Halogeometricum borinquense TaxID=60847 RepID=E4NWE1_HALBP|nr:sugar phosphate nucleotidyltransferase [Halogeometricum borinquense]ADQ69361.1 Nucleoside-diphosphate-sugar pyrophosphorylase family protein [Halogeometricum borinquense DSM 11551]ELY26250.1 Nucleoside-diphosphate-sugar pyrophosphorylase family protein [Halogeometricum borinquense DSM 11551]
MSAVSEAVVLAAGEGRRLRPLTKYLPKPMLPVANRPVIDYVLDALVESGIERVVVVVGYRGDRIQTHLTAEYKGANIEFVQQPSRLGSGHALLQATGMVNGEFLVVNGDSIINAAIVTSTLERYDSTDCAATVAVAHSDTPEEYGVVITNRGLIADIDEHPVEREGYVVNAGVYVFDESVFAALDRTEPWQGEIRLTDAIEHLDGPVTSILVNGGWLDPSTPWQLLSVSETLLGSRFGSDVYVADSARVHESAVVEGPVVIGKDCDVGPGAVIRPGTCLQDNVHVGANAVVERSILSTDAHVGAHTLLRDSVVGSGARIGDCVASPGGRADVVVDGRLYTDRKIGSIVADRATVGANATLAAGSSVGAEATVGAGVVVDGPVREKSEVAA